MKKIYFLSFLMVLSTIKLYAQLKVSNDGKVKIASTFTNSQSLLTVGNSGYSTGATSIGVIGSPIVKDSKINVGVLGNVVANQAHSHDKNYGVLGITGVNGNHGRNFGVSGMIGFNPNYSYLGGAGIYATNYTYMLSNPDNIQGLYAAYFHGNTNLHGRTIAQEIYTPADERLSENVESMSIKSRESGNTLDNLLELNVLEYNLKNQQTTRVATNAADMPDEIRQAYEYMKKDEEKMNSRRRYGVSAQQLQKVYPNLVMEGQDGYLYVNYTELVPLLLRSIQELKAELDEVKGNNDKVKYARAADYDDESADVSDATKNPSVASLAQNTPNPFTERTTIRFTLPDNTRNAYIYIFDMSGKMQKQILIDSSMQSVTIEGYELCAGMYIYSLVIGGKEVKTRRMILSK